MTKLADAFTYSDGSLPDPPWSCPWSGFALPTIFSNHIEAANSGTSTFAVHDTQCASQVQFSQASFAIPSPTAHYYECSVCVRMNSGSVFVCYQFAWYYDSGAYHYAIFKNKADGSFETLVTASAGSIAQTLRIEVDDDDNITCRANGVTVLTYHDTTSPLTGTGVGLGLYRQAGTGITGDAWTGGDSDSYVEDFNRAGPGLGSDWTSTGSGSTPPSISSNQAVLASGSDSNEIRTAETFDADQEHYVDVTVSGQGFAWVAVRNTVDMTNMYEIVWGHSNGGQYALYSAEANADLAVVTGIGYSGTRRLGIKVIGNTITCYADGVVVLGPVTDSGSPSGGAPAFGGFLVSGSIAFDNDFGIGITDGVPPASEILLAAPGVALMAAPGIPLLAS